MCLCHLLLRECKANVGLYFPIRLMMMRLTHYYPWDFFLPSAECQILVVYLTAALFVSLALNKRK